MSPRTEKDRSRGLLHKLRQRVTRQGPAGNQEPQDLEFANLDNIKELPKIKHQVAQLTLSNLPRLERVRTEALRQSSKVKLEKLPKLKTLPDLSGKVNFDEVSIANIANLKVLPDQYISRHTKLENMESLTGVPYEIKRDIGESQDPSINVSFQNLPKVQRLPTMIFQAQAGHKCNIEIVNLPNLEHLPRITGVAKKSDDLVADEDQGDDYESPKVDVFIHLENLPKIDNLEVILPIFNDESNSHIDLARVRKITLKNLSQELKISPRFLVDAKEIEIDGCNLLSCSKANNTEVFSLGYDSKLEKISLKNLQNLNFLKSVNFLRKTKELVIEKCSFSQQEQEIFADSGCNIIEICNCPDLENLGGKWPKFSSNITLKNLENLKFINGLSGLDALQVLTIEGCPKLNKKETLKELLILRGKGCLIILRDDEMRKDFDKIWQKYGDAQTALAKINELKLKYSSSKLFERFLTEGIEVRPLKQSAESLLKVLKFIEENSSAKTWIDEIAKAYLEGCINQPVAGFLEISFWIQVAKEENIQERIEMAKALLVMQKVRDSVHEVSSCKSFTKYEMQAGSAFEVEASNYLFKKLYQKLSEDRLLKKEWQGVPEKICFEGFISDFYEKHFEFEAFYKSITELLEKDDEYFMKDLCQGHLKFIWQEINFPNLIEELNKSVDRKQSSKQNLLEFKLNEEEGRENKRPMNIEGIEDFNNMVIEELKKVSDSKGRVVKLGELYAQIGIERDQDLTNEILQATRGLYYPKPSASISSSSSRSSSVAEITQETRHVVSSIV